MTKYDFWWKYIEQPKRKLWGNIQYKLLKRDNAYLIQKEANKWRNQLMLDYCNVVRLLGWTDQYKEDDYYWVIDSKREGVHLSSCVGGFQKLKGRLSTWDYLYTENLWEMNNRDVESGLEEARLKGIIVK